MRDWNQEVRARLSAAGVAPGRENEIVEELALHLRERCEELQARGKPEAEAEAIMLGELEQGHLADEIRRLERMHSQPVVLGESSRGSWPVSLWQDVRYGARVLRLNPAFTVICIVSLALGIGANTAIFQLINAVRLRTLPVKDAERLAIVRIPEPHGRSGNFAGPYSDLTFPMWQEIQQRQEGFSDIAAWSRSGFNLASGGEVRYARGRWVSGDFFKVVGVDALLGRVLTGSDDVKGCSNSGAVLSYSFWQRQFAGDPNVLGRPLSLDGHTFTVIGVTPASFYGIEVGRNYDLALPLCSEPLIRGGEASMMAVRHGWWLAVIGRLKPGWNLQKATAQLEAVSPAIMESTLPPVYDAEGARHYRGYKLGALPGANGFSQLRRQYETPLWLLLAVSGVVLLIACANLANLMLARASAREREIAVRLALGASRGRLVRQLLTESLLLSVSGALLAALLATNLSAFLVRMLSSENAQVYLDRALDWRVLGFTAALAALTCMIFALAPALKATSEAPARIMNAAGRGLTSSRERFTMRRILAIAQVSLSLVLLVGALLFVRTLRNLLTLDAGFQRDGVLVVDVDFTPVNVPMTQRVQYRENLLERVRALPGVESAAETYLVPLSGSGWNNNVVVGGKKIDANVNMDRVSTGYFQTMGMQRLAGRDFNSGDTLSSPKVAIVNQEFARKVLGGADPIGKTFKIDVYQGETAYEYQIVGLVKNTKYYDLREDFDPIAFYPHTQELKPDPGTEIMVRSQLPISSLMAEVKAAVAQVNGGINIDFHVMNTQVKDSLLRERLLASLSGFFGVLAAILATVGLYGVIAYMVVRRTNEIGIRMALGAQPRSILAMIVREAAVLLSIGVAIGVLLSIFAARTATSLLFGLKPYDLTTLLLASLGLGVVTVAASLLPASRAARLDPMVALREQ